jgi:hypothetical protein
MIGTFTVLTEASSNPNLPRLTQVLMPYGMTTAGLSVIQFSVRPGAVRPVTFKLSGDTGNFYSDEAGTQLVGKEISFSTAGVKKFGFRATASGTFIIYNPDEILMIGNGVDWGPGNDFITSASNCQIKGFDISYLGNFTNIRNINFSGHSVKGDLSSLSGLSALQSVILVGALAGDITGSLSNLANKPALITVRISGMLEFDMSLIPSTVKTLQVDLYATAKIRYTAAGINTFASALDLVNVNAGIASEPTEVDKILQSFNTAPAAQSARNLRIKGPRTAASDAVVASLSTKNYTVVLY